MNSEDIDIFDFQRILIGEVPGSFFIEVIIRLIVIYILALTSMRLMGKRMAAQLSRNELLALVSIAAAIGVSVQAPDRGLLSSFVIVLVIILLGRFVAYRAFKSWSFEVLSQGSSNTLVSNGELRTQVMKKNRVSKERVFAQLRSLEIKQLGEVERLYLEAGGKFSLLKTQEPIAGLSIIPDWDQELRDEQEKEEQKNACEHCGRIEEKKPVSPCLNCGNNDWIIAVKP